jgi:hypothetical protein
MLDSVRRRAARAAAIVPLGLPGLLLGCSGPDGAAVDAGPEGGGDAGGPPTTTLPFTVADYPGGGKLLLVPVSVNGSAPFDVLLDTGSSGLRVFASKLAGVSVDVTTETNDAEFGGGDTLFGHTATGTVRFGDAGGVTTPAPIAFQLVESFGCAASNPTCDLASGSDAFFTDAGIFGILGVGLRPGVPADVFSPFAQLGPTLSTGFVIATGGFASTAGVVLLGLADPAAAGFTTVSLPSIGTLGNGAPAWGDDQVSACFRVNGAATAPACTAAVFDTGSDSDVLYGPNLPAVDVAGGALAPGVSFEATVSPALDLAFVVGPSPTASQDLVWVDTTDPFATLSIEVFFRHDVSFDLAGGRIGFKP